MKELGGRELRVEDLNKEEGFFYILLFIGISFLFLENGCVRYWEKLDCCYRDFKIRD